MLKLKADRFKDKKLTLRDVLKVKASGGDEIDVETIARRLLRLDYQALFQSDDLKTGNSNSTAINLISLGSGISTQNPNSTGVHPLDRLLLTIASCDDLLRQDIVSKLARCKLAMPFLITDHLNDQDRCLLWPHMKHFVSWKLNNQCNTEAFVSLPFFVATIARLGRPPVAKSAIASKLFKQRDNDNHNYFLSCVEARKDYRKVASAKMVDMFFDVPTNDVTSLPAYDTSLLLFNMHGCISKASKQAKALTTVSHVMVLAVDESYSDAQYAQAWQQLNTNSYESLIVLLPFAQEKDHIMFDRFVSTNFPILSLNAKVILTSGMTNEAIGFKLRQQITEEMKTSNARLRSLDKDITEAVAACGIKIDTETAGLSFARHRADELNNTLTEFKGKKVSQIMQLQERQQKVAIVDKEMERLANKKNEMNVLEYQAELEQKYADQKKNAVLLFNKIINNHKRWQTMSIKSLYELATNESVYRYLRWISLFLMVRNRRVIEPLSMQRDMLRQLLLQLKRENSGADLAEIEQLKSQINELQTQIMDFNFTVEHLLREISEMYRVGVLWNDQPSYGATESEFLHHLPMVHAQMMLSGYPVEFMNGDSGSVNVQWLRKIFQCIEQLLGRNLKIWVVSILGIQSSGKSTLLNEMFGIDLSVSSGRCTRGIYAQLIDVGDSVPGCTHILLLDTEGLRAPELMKPGEDNQRDNELATFVIGVADLTIINIMGETENDVQETLQITVHALLRMNKVNLSPMLLLVHQNVPDRMAMANTIQARENIQSVLDTVARQAAEADGYRDVKCFTDVIKFDYSDQDQVTYLPSLFAGNHINLNYVAQAQDFQAKLFRHLSANGPPANQLDGIFQRIASLWSAIQRENFVFSFKNSQEILAYNDLQDTVSKWEWALISAGKQWEDETSNKLKGVDDVDEAMEIDMNKKLNDCMDLALKNILNEHEDYFEHNQYAQTLSQWNETTKQKLRSLKDSKVLDLWTTCLQDIKKLRARNNVKANQERNQQKFRKIVKDHIKKQQRKRGAAQSHVNDAQLKRLFEREWVEIFEKCKREVGLTPMTKTNVANMLERGVISAVYEQNDVCKKFLSLVKNKSAR